jgi:hypothetical protein
MAILYRQWKVYSRTKGISSKKAAVYSSRGAWGSVVHGSAVCTQRPNPLLGSDAADIARASKLPHAVQDIDRHVDFGYSTFVYT